MSPAARLASAIALVSAMAMPAAARVSVENAGFGLDLLWVMSQVRSTEDVRARALAQLRANDIDGTPGLSARDREMLIERQVAESQARYIERWLVRDLDHNFEISTEELRVSLVDQASSPLRQGNLTVTPVPAQIEEILTTLVARALETVDLDKNGTVTLAELTETSDTRITTRSTFENNIKLFPPAAMDADGDGSVSEAEAMAVVDALITEFDTDNDGNVSVLEQSAARDLLRPYLAAARRDAAPDQGERTGTLPRGGSSTYDAARAACAMPEVPDGEQVVVVGGYEGGALSDVYLGETPRTVTVADLFVPPVGPPLYVIAPFYGDMILRISGNGSRIRDVVFTRGEVALAGSGIGDARLHRAPDACHLEVWEKITDANPEASTFYGGRLGKPIATSLTAYTLGAVNLETGRNAADAVLTGAEPHPRGEEGNIGWTRFDMFNPGGLIHLDPATVRAVSPVSKHDPMPQMAGIANLIEDATLVYLPDDSITPGEVLEDDEGRIRMGGKTFVPGSGDDLISMGGLYYTEERPKVWVGRRPLVFLVTRPFRVPAGLSGAHKVHFLLPEGMAEPTGELGHSEIRRLRRDGSAAP